MEILRFIKLACLSTAGLLIQLGIQAQSPVAFFTFDNGCIAEETEGNFITNQVLGAPTCDCGPVQDAMIFDGVDDVVILDPGLKDVIGEDFTLAFYFWADDAPSSFNILSALKPDCIDRDSTMQIQYIAGPSVLEFNFNKNIGERVNFTTALDDNLCWHQVIVTRSNDEYSFYVDQVFLQTINLGTDFKIAEAAQLFIGNTECMSIGEQLFDGMIDELRFYDRVLSIQEIEDLDVFPDKIITESTTIFEGESIQVNTGGTCAPSFSWTNPGDLDDPMSLNPIITPTQTTEYVFSTDHGTCSSSDTILISVIADEDIDCNNLLLPRAFTPNGDGLNDTYGISNEFIVEDLEYFQIFDRWGTKVFETNQLGERWDGQFKSAPLTPGTFVYKINYSCLSDSFIKTGSFNILK